MKCNVKESAYLAIVCPSLEYASVAWDPYHNKKIEHLEKVQRKAARWVVNNFSCHSSVTAVLQHLQWPTLQLRRKISKLQTLFRIIHQEYPQSIPSYFTPMKRSTRLYHPRHFILPNSFTYAY